MQYIGAKISLTYHCIVVEGASGVEERMGVIAREDWRK